jgi:lysophospholipase L1-like esterase
VTFKSEIRRPRTIFLALLLVIVLNLVILAFSHSRACHVACVVMIGDSITFNWPNMASPSHVAGLVIVNRGRPSDTTAHMVSRFHHDVVELRPRAVVILGGQYDLERIPVSTIAGNLSEMAQAATQNGIRVVMATLPPRGEYGGDRPVSADSGAHDKIRALNDWIRDLAGREHYALADYHRVLSDERGFYLAGLTADGVHPSAEGYQRMEAVLREAMESALGSEGQASSGAGRRDGRPRPRIETAARLPGRKLQHEVT